jgi:hypothetical protein
MSSLRDSLTAEEAFGALPVQTAKTANKNTV